MILFLDANVLIYLLECKEPFSRQTAERIAGLRRYHPDLALAVSRLSWLECHVHPMRTGNQQALEAFGQFFARPDLRCVELTREVVELATCIRAQCNLRTPDALQAACCLQMGPEHLMLTGDVAFGRVAGLNVMFLDSAALPGTP